MKRESYVLTPELLTTTMIGEQDAIDYYEKLAQMAPNENFARVIMGFREDEMKHLGNSKALFKRLSGQSPELPPVKQPRIRSFQEGLEQAIFDELGAYEAYRNIYLDNDQPIIRNIFFENLTDEMEHAAKINFMLTALKAPMR